jgi:hypothetical protein
MQCYYHQSNPAVGICKNCNRGICVNCAAEVADDIACRNRCEQIVTDMALLIARNTRVT